MTTTQFIPDLPNFSFKSYTSIADDVINSGQGKLVNLATNGLPGSTTIMNIGSPNSGTFVVNLWGQVVNQLQPMSGTVRPTPIQVGQFFLDQTLGPYGQPIWCGQISPAVWINAAGVQV